VFALSAAAAAVTSAVAGEPSISLDTRPESQFGSFEDRSAPSTYQYDSPPYTTWSALTAAREIVGVNAFDAVGGSDLITSISCVWLGVGNGTTQRLFVWQDVGTGELATAKLVAEQSVIVANSNTATMNVYPLSAPVPVSGRFYVGFSSVSTVGLGVTAFQNVPSGVLPHRSFIGAAVPPFVASDLATMVLPFQSTTARGNPGYFAVRANGNGSAFTYQGRLAQSGQNYAGNADFIMTVYDSAEGGVVVGAPVAIANVAVSAGVFSVQIPADPSWFVNASDRYLDVQVRTPAGGDGAYTPMTPRQRIGQVPAAMVATVAQSVPWSGLTGIPTNVAAWDAVPGGIAFSGGVVGIGTSSPGAALQVSGGPAYRNLDVDSSYQEGTWFNLTNTGANGRMWSLVSTGSGNTEGAGALLIRDNNAFAVRAAFLPNGNVGFGTTTPTRRVQVKGDGVGFSHTSTDGASELATSVDTNAGWIGMPGPKNLLLFTNNVPRMTVVSDGRVGIGTTTPDEALDVRGNVRMGNSGEYQAVGASAEKLSIIRGVVNANGSIRWGAGYTVTRSGFGLYRVSWTDSPGFSDPPAATATAYLAGAPIVVYSIGAQTNGDGSGYVDFRTVNLSGLLTDSAFSFTLVGPR